MLTGAGDDVLVIDSGARFSKSKGFAQLVEEDGYAVRQLDCARLWKRARGHPFLSAGNDQLAVLSQKIVEHFGLMGASTVVHKPGSKETELAAAW